jgi:hypothetical protein
MPHASPLHGGREALRAANHGPGAAAQRSKRRFVLWRRNFFDFFSSPRTRRRDASRATERVSLRKVHDVRGAASAGRGGYDVARRSINEDKGQMTDIACNLADRFIVAEGLATVVW